MKKILVKCIALGVSSLAMPTIGAGKHQYPEDVVLGIIKQAVESISAENAGHLTLRDVSVIVFEDKQPNESETKPSFRGARRRFMYSSARTAIAPPQPPKFNHAALSTAAKIRERREISSPTVTTSANPECFLSLTYESVNLVLKEGDITKQKADAIINVLPKSLKLSDGGGVCKSILKEGGQTVQDELDKLPRNIILPSVFVTSAGAIPNIKKIIHFVPTTTAVVNLQVSIEKCLHSAQQHSLIHVLIPAIGTANLNITPKVSVDLILNAARNFSRTSYSLTLEIVIFQKDMVPDFKKIIEEKLKELNIDVLKAPAGSTVKKSGNNQVGNTSFTTNLTSKTLTTDVNARSTATSVRAQSGNGNDAVNMGITDEIQLRVVGFKQNIDEAFNDLRMFVDSNKAEKSISSIGDIISNHRSEIETLSTIFHVRTKCSVSGVITVEGQKGDVADFRVKFTEMQKKYEMEELEKKFLDKRTLHSEHVSDNLPTHWVAQPEGQVVHLVSLLESSDEYKEIASYFETSFKTGRVPNVTKIERIQNPALFRAYLVKKKCMVGRENEMRLFHGTAVENTPFINGNNFNRSYAGDNVGAMYGNGVYFTNESSYAVGYCADSQGMTARYLSRPITGRGKNTARSSTTSFQMYVVKVLVGDFVQGKQGIKEPPSKNDKQNPSLRFDSVVNDLIKPTIFVIFQDNQCYPEYLITFTHTSTSH